MTFPTLALTSPHKKGKFVEEAQLLLRTNRFDTPFFTATVDGDFGPVTAGACVQAKYWLGYPKRKQTPTYGDFLHSYLLPLTTKGARKLPLPYQLTRKLRIQQYNNTPPRVKALALAKTFLGYRETGDNLTTFGAWYGLNGNPWCAMFVSYNLDHCGSRFRESYVPDIVMRAWRGQGCYVTYSPQPGDLVCYDWNNNGEYDHVEFFDSWADGAAGTFSAVGGNTLPPGGQGDRGNGGGVYENVRGTHQGYRVVFVRVTS